MDESLSEELLNTAGCLCRCLCISSWEGANFVTEDPVWKFALIGLNNSDQTVVGKSYLTNEKMLPFLWAQGPGCNNTYLCGLAHELVVCLVGWINRRCV